MFTYQESLLIASNLADKDLDNFLLLDPSVQKKVVRVLGSVRETSAETSAEPQLRESGIETKEIKPKKEKQLRTAKVGTCYSTPVTFKLCKSKKAGTWGYNIRVTDKVTEYLQFCHSVKSVSEVEDYISETYKIEKSKKLNHSIQVFLSRMVEVGKVVKVSRGKYKWKNEETKPYYNMIKEFFEKNKGTAFSIQGLVAILTEEHYEILSKVDEETLTKAFKKIVDHLYDQKFVSQYVDPNGAVLYFFVGPATT